MTRELSVPEHIETYLGRIEKGWSQPDAAVKVVKCGPVPRLGCDALVTLGLHRHSLSSLVSDKTIHQELLLLLREPPPRAAAVLGQVTEGLLASHQALLRGDVLGPRGPLWPGSQFTALYAAPPALLPEAFATCGGPEGKTVVFVWLVPITTAEAAFVMEHGWSAFEDRLEALDPDMLDPKRPAVSVAAKA